MNLLSHSRARSEDLIELVLGMRQWQALWKRGKFEAELARTQLEIVLVAIQPYTPDAA